MLAIRAEVRKERGGHFDWLENVRSFEEVIIEAEKLGNANEVIFELVIRLKKAGQLIIKKTFLCRCLREIVLYLYTIGTT